MYFISTINKHKSDNFLIIVLILNMKYLALAAMLALSQAEDDLEYGDSTAAEVVIVASEDEQEEVEEDEGVQDYHETYNYDADTGIYTMTKQVDEYFEFAMVYAGDEELEAGVIPDCSLGAPCGEDAETVCCYRLDMQKEDSYETSYRCMNKVISHADINF